MVSTAGPGTHRAVIPNARMRLQEREGNGELEGRASGVAIPSQNADAKLESRIRLVQYIFEEQERDLITRLAKLRQVREASLKGLYRELMEIDKDFVAWQAKKKRTDLKGLSVNAPQSLDQADPKVAGSQWPVPSSPSQKRSSDREAPPSARNTSAGTGKASAGTRKTSVAKYFYKMAAVVGSNYFSIYDGKTEFIAGVPISQTVPLGRELLPSVEYPEFVFTTPAQARKERFPRNAAMLHTPRAMVKCITSGRFRDFGNGCFWFENMAPVSITAWYSSPRKSRR